MASEIHVGDSGTELIIRVLDDGSVVNISGASLLNMILKKPGGTSVTKSASLYTDGTDGKLTYTADPDDFDVAGLYKIQGQVTISTGSFYTSQGTFQVHCNL